MEEIVNRLLNIVSSKIKNSEISSDAPLWLRIFGEDHITVFGLLAGITSILPIRKPPKLTFLIIIGICLALNGAIHLAVINFKGKR